MNPIWIIVTICVFSLICSSFAGGAYWFLTFSTPSPLTGTPVKQLGSFSMNPWGSASNFIDKQAQWIWNIDTAATDAPLTPIKFSTQFMNSSLSELPATLHVIVDNSATVTLNGTKIGDVAGGGWATQDYSKIKMNLKSGNNIIDIVAANAGGPAGLIASLVKDSDKSVLMRTDSSWVWNNA